MRDIFNIMDIEGTSFPTGRCTRVVIGDNGMTAGEHFVQGYVVVSPGGSVPCHSHGEEESYTILSGQGKMILEDQEHPAGPLDVFFIRPHISHSLVNTGDTDLVFMFVYAPKKIADHWAEELAQT